MVIEIDGDSHFYDESIIEDQKREEILKGMGLYFLRFLDNEVKKSMPFVLEQIGFFIDDFENKNRLQNSSFH